MRAVETKHFNGSSGSGQDLEPNGDLRHAAIMSVWLRVWCDGWAWSLSWVRPAAPQCHHTLDRSWSRNGAWQMVLGALNSATV